MNTKKLSFFVGAFLASLASNAVTPVFQAYSNGSMMYAFDYNAARTGVAVQVRNKDKPDEPWTTLNGTFSAKWNTTKYALWTFRTNFSHTLEVRIAEITSSGTGDFDAVDDVLCTMPLMGDILTSSSSIGPYAFDGLFNITDTQWAGYDFGSVKRISKIRYIFRFDTGALGWSSRWAGSSFQVASDASFSDASNVATVTTAGYTIDHMQEIEFNPPIETRYIRHWDDSHSSLCECEFISPDFNAYIPAPEIADYTFYQTNLVISWSIPAIYAQLSNVLERARSEEGPWTEVSRVLFPGETMCHTDMTAKVGLKYFYRVRGYSGHKAYHGQKMYSPVASSYRMRCLERDLSNPSVLYDHAVILRESADTDSHYARKRYAFDGNTANANVSGNFPDIYKKPHLGFDFGSACYFGAVWYSGRINALGRVNGLKIWGSNDTEDPTGYPIALSEAFSCNGSTGTGVSYALSPDLEKYRYIYAWKDSDWYGNVAEMCLFGWTREDLVSSGETFAPKSLSGTNADSAGAVKLTWGEGYNLTGYDIEKRVEGEEGWTIVLAGLPPETRSCEVAGLEVGKWYEFRLAARGSETDDYSRICRIYVYQLIPGHGTGLRTILYGAQNVMHITTEPTVETLVMTNAEIDQAGGTLFTTANHEKAWVFMYGKIIVPLDGKYTFRLESSGSDGYTFALDGSAKIRYGNSAGIKEASVYLTAGEHDLFIGYASVNSRKLLRFSWSLESVWNLRTVPTSQLVPMDEETLSSYLPSSFEGWRCALPTVNTSVHPHVRFLSPGKYELQGSANDYRLDNCALMTRLVRGPFVFDIDVVAAGGRSGIFVTDESGSSANSMVLLFTGRQRGLKSHTADLLSPSWANSSATCQRLERLDDGTLNFYMKTRSATTWTLIVSLPQGKWAEKNIDLSGRKLTLGFHNFYNSGSFAVIDNITLRTRDKGMFIILR